MAKANGRVKRSGVIIHKSSKEQAYIPKGYQVAHYGEYTTRKSCYIIIQCLGARKPLVAGLGTLIRPCKAHG